MGAVWSGYTFFPMHVPHINCCLCTNTKNMQLTWFYYDILANKYAWGIKQIFEISGLNEFMCHAGLTGESFLIKLCGY